MDDRSREPLSRPGEPTTAAPGSARKIRILMERASRREALFHPLDGLRRQLGTDRRMESSTSMEGN